MNVADLMKPRYKVTHTMPWPNFKVGDILTEHLLKVQKVGHINTYNVWSLGEPTLGKGNYLNDAHFPDKYPHLFRKLAWYEERDVKDMPEYVREDKTGKVYKLLDESQDNRIYGHRSDEMELRIFKYSVGYLGQKYSPASQHDYETFKNGTK